jgi:hypothetical protein
MGLLMNFAKGFKQSLSMVGIRFFGLDLKTEPKQSKCLGSSDWNLIRRFTALKRSV